MAWELKGVCVFPDAAQGGDMQPRFMSTEAFLRFEKEWQHLRRAVHKLEIEANRPDAQKIEGMAGSELADSPVVRIKSS
ncbi:hypothetical protein EPK84_02460 (plasmid) [Sinorhizobium fredii]|nr:hypothetical protein EPK84_02460 [Sinorhizobium fredii]